MSNTIPAMMNSTHVIEVIMDTLELNIPTENEKDREGYITASIRVNETLKRCFFEKKEKQSNTITALELVKAIMDDLISNTPDISNDTIMGYLRAEKITSAVLKILFVDEENK